MPNSACLHVQFRDDHATNVVAMPDGTARVGRAGFCDIRLPDAALPDEVCRLNRRGDRQWELAPVGTLVKLSIGGRRIERPRLISFDEPFAVGGFTLTLRPAEALPQDVFGNPESLIELEPRVELAEPGPAGVIAPEPSAPNAPAPPAERRPAPRPRPEPVSPLAGPADRWQASRVETKRWESKWRGAAAKLATAASEAPAPVRPARPAVAPRPPVAPLGRAVDLKETNRTEFTRRVEPFRVPKVARTAVLPSEPASFAYQRPANPVERAAFRPAPAPAQARYKVAEPHPRSMPIETPFEAATPRTSAVALVDIPATAPPRPIHGRTSVRPIPPPMPPLARHPAPAPERPTALEPADPVVPASAPASEIEASAVAENYRHLPVIAEDFEADEEYLAVEPITPRMLGSVRRLALPAETEAEAVRHAVIREASVPTVMPGSPRPVDESALERLAVWFEQSFRAGEWPQPADIFADRAAPPSGASFEIIDVEFASTPNPTEDVASDDLPAEAAAEESASHSFFVADTSTHSVNASWVSRHETNPIEETFEGEPEPAAAPDELLGMVAGLPSVHEILAAQSARGRATAGRTTRLVTAEVPTDPRRPSEWSLPLWLGWVPASAASVGVGLVLSAAAYTWTVDGYNAGVVAARLGPDGNGVGLGPNAKPLPEGVAVGRTSWWATTARNLTTWSTYLDRTAADPAASAEARALLDRAVEASPLEASARFTLAHPLPNEPEPGLARGLGQTRDVVSLTWSGRQLLAAGKPDAARNAYRAALEMAARTDPARPVTPGFLDAPHRRYALPTEELISGVVRDMAGQSAWRYKDWSGDVPKGTVATLAVARVLRELRSEDADAALDAALAEAEDVGTNADPAESAVRLAARAEALALKGRWADAEERYREAIDRMPADVVRRSWWINVADLASRLSEDPSRLRALELAKSNDLKDEVTLRAVDLQKSLGLGVRPELRTARAADTPRG